MNRLPHLNDEAVAAFADGVLRGAPRARACQHLSECAECAGAVHEQRQASFALRAAHAPALPSGLIDRLRELPITAPLPRVDVVSGLTPDGRPVFAAYSALPAAPITPSSRPRPTPSAVPSVPSVLPSVPSVLPPDTSAELVTHHRSRRGLLPGIGLGAMTAAAIVVGALASTAANAGGASPAPIGRPGGNAPSVSVRPALLPVNRDALLLSGRP